MLIYNSMLVSNGSFVVVVLSVGFIMPVGPVKYGRKKKGECSLVENITAI